jgi:hypothetical protein
MVLRGSEHEVRAMSRIPYDDFLDICDVKARYCRCLDEKDWHGYGNTFTADAVLDTTPSGGDRVQGREQLVQNVRGSIETAVTAHQVHSPEMTLLDADTVDVIWAMQDRVIWDEQRAGAIGARSLTGFGHYRERYVRCEDGRWRIAQSRLTRLHVDLEPSAGGGK